MKPSTLLLLSLFPFFTLACHKTKNSDVRMDALSNTDKLGCVHNWKGTYSVKGAQDTSYYLTFDMPIIVHNDSTIEFLYAGAYQNTLLCVSSYNDTTKTIVYTAKYERTASAEAAYDTMIYNYGTGLLEYSGYMASNGNVERRKVQSP